MEIGTEKTKLMTNISNGISTNIRINGKKLKTVQTFRQLEAVVSDEGPLPETVSRTARTAVLLTRLGPLWKENTILGCKTWNGLPRLAHSHAQSSAAKTSVDLLSWARRSQWE